MTETKKITPWLGTGRRKTAVARVRLFPGNGLITINGRVLDDYFQNDRSREYALRPLKIVKELTSFDVKARLNGGGLDGQAGAFVLGLARALIKADPEYGQSLRDDGLLTRDGRMKERKKFGKKGARASFQFSKR